MNPFFYDLLRGLRSRGVLVMIGLTTLLSLTVLALGLHALAHHPGVSADMVTGFVVNSMGAIYGFFIPVLGLVAGYETYARDRVTGVLESVLCRPVTRTQLVVTRFLALVLASAIAIALALGLIDLLLYAETSDALPAGTFGALLVALLVEAAAFGGLTILFSHLFRSTGMVQGFSVVTFVVFSIIWYILIVVALLSSGYAGGNPTQALGAMVFADYFNPAQFALLVTAYVEQSFFFGLVSAPPGTIGLTLGGLALSGVAWSVLPFAGACYLAGKHD